VLAVGGRQEVVRSITLGGIGRAGLVRLRGDVEEMGPGKGGW